MKTFAKIVAGFAVVIGVMVLVTNWFLSDKLDNLVRDSMIEAGSKNLETGFALESVSISIPDASAELKGIRIDNPEGYSDGPVLLVGSILVDIDMSTINDPVLVIEEVTIEDPQVFYEINDEGVANLDVLQERLEKNANSGSSNEETRLIIERLDFRGGTITASAQRDPEQQLVFDFPVVFLTDLGDPDGATAETIGNRVSEVLFDRVIAAAQRAGVDALVENQKERLLEKAEEKIGEKLKGLLDKDDDG